MKRHDWMRAALAASLALNVGVVAAVAVLRPALWAPGTPPISTAVHLPDHLQLDAAQRTQWQALEPPFLHDLGTNWRAIRHHREALVRQVLAPTPNRAAINDEQSALARLQSAQQQRVVDQLLAERAVLNEPQRERLLDLLLTRYAQEATEEELLHRK